MRGSHRPVLACLGGVEELASGAAFHGAGLEPFVAVVAARVRVAVPKDPTPAHGERRKVAGEVLHLASRDD
jgi:hypothetical protein